MQRSEFEAVVAALNYALAGADSGFDTAAGMGPAAPSVVWDKLRALRAGADLASQRLL